MFEVTVREGAPLITVMFRVAKEAGCTLVPTSSLFEIATQLKLRESLRTCKFTANYLLVREGVYHVLILNTCSFM